MIIYFFIGSYLFIDAHPTKGLSSFQVEIGGQLLGKGSGMSREEAKLQVPPGRCPEICRLCSVMIFSNI